MEKIRFDPTAYQSLVDSERDLNQALNEVQKLEECDVDCQEFRSQINQAIQRSIKLRQNFGPEAI